MVEVPDTPGELLNTATVSSSTPEGAPGDETVSATVQVLAPPTIVTVSSVAATEDGVLLPARATLSSMRQLYLETSHELSNPGGHADPLDVTNPSAYRLFRALPEDPFPASNQSL